MGIGSGIVGASETVREAGPWARVGRASLGQEVAVVCMLLQTSAFLDKVLERNMIQERRGSHVEGVVRWQIVVVWGLVRE